MSTSHIHLGAQLHQSWARLQFLLRTDFTWRVAAVFAGCSALVGALGWSFHFEAERISAQVSQAEAALRHTARSSELDPGAPGAIQSIPVGPLDSRALPNALYTAAQEQQIGLGDINFAQQPGSVDGLLIHRAELTLQARFPSIYRFIQTVQTRVPTSTLDGLRCSREDAAAEIVRCAIVLVAFYRKT